MKPFAAISVIALIFAACNGGENKRSSSNKPVTPPPATYKADSVVERVIVNLGDTIMPKQYILTTKDSAANADILNKKLNDIFYVSGPAIAAKSKLTVTGKPIAWFKTQEAPYFFEAGIGVDKAVKLTDKKYSVKTIESDSAFIAKFYGPRSGTSVAHTALQERMTDTKRKLKRAAYEIYVGRAFDSAGKAVNPYKVETDIIYPY